MRRRHSILTRAAAIALLAGVAAAAPSMTIAGGGCHMDLGSVYTEGTATVVRMDVCSFAPTVTRVAVGTEVRFLNTDTVPHNVLGRGRTWASADLFPGNEFVHRFDAVGSYPFACSIHPGMVGAVVVGDGMAAAPVSVSDEPAVASAVVDAPGAGTGLVVGVGAIGLLTGIALGLLIGRRRSPTRGAHPVLALDD